MSCGTWHPQTVLVAMMQTVVTQDGVRPVNIWYSPSLSIYLGGGAGMKYS